MEIVIKIPEAIIKGAKDSPNYYPSYLFEKIWKAVAKGTVLPKGHGRLGDLGKIYIELNEAQIEGTEEYKGLGEAKQIICNAKTIIEGSEE